MKNAFNLELFEIKEVMQDKKVRTAIGSMLLPVLTCLGISSTRSKEIITKCLEIASTYSKLEEYEEQAHNVLKEEQVTEKIPEKLTARADLLYTQIRQYLLPGNVLDYGCGDGQVAEYIAKNKKQQVCLTDVYEHKHVKETGLEFRLFKQGEKAPFADNEFDNILTITVFHHSDNPVDSIKDATRVTKKNGRILVIESVYGVKGKELPESTQENTKSYLSLNPEQQRKVNIFFDHFYNRVLHYSKDTKTKANVPFNFNTPDNWRKIFIDCGLKQETIIHLGLDQPTVPEYHTLHVLRKL